MHIPDVTSQEAIERLAARVDVDEKTGCWLWRGACVGNGYGAYNLYIDGEERATWGAHRVAWRAHNGPIPQGLHVLHRCDVPRCINPAHLFIGTHATNMADMAAKGRARRNPMACPHGHPYDGDNVYYSKDRPSRRCRTCQNKRTREAHRIRLNIPPDRWRHPN